MSSEDGRRRFPFWMGVVAAGSVAVAVAAGAIWEASNRANASDSVAATGSTAIGNIVSNSDVSKNLAATSAAHTTPSDATHANVSQPSPPPTAGFLPNAAVGTMESVPGHMYVLPWFFDGGTSDSHTVTDLQVKASFQLAGVTWTLPSNAGAPGQYLIVPTVVNGKAYLVWCMAPEMADQNSLSGYPKSASVVWMTPWRSQGGSLADGAVKVTDIPRVWSVTGRFVFSPSNQPVAYGGPDADFVSGAWTEWFHGRIQGSVSQVVKPNGGTETVAFPTMIWPAYDGVVISIVAHERGTNQGGSDNLYYINLAKDSISGIASLMGGGGTFLDFVVGNGAVYIQESNDLSGNGTFQGTSKLFDEYRNVHVSAPFDSTQAGRPTLQDGILYDPQNHELVNLHLPATVLQAMTPEAFGVTK